MAIPVPNLDDRHFQQIVDEVKRRIPEYCPEWTDHNVSDPGVTLIELFAWMVDMLIYRVNRVPEKSYLTFMNLMGLQRNPPAAARTVLTFWLAAPASGPIAIPAATAIGTVQTTSEPSVNVQTDREVILRPPQLNACLTSINERSFEDQTAKLIDEREAFLAFSRAPSPGNAFYLGNADDISRHIIALTIDCAIEGIGVDPKQPPLAWEGWNGESWVELEIERDETGGLNTRGQVVLYMLPRMARHTIAGKQAYWLRCRHIPPRPQQPTYAASPLIRTITATTIGGTISAAHTRKITSEILGRSNGQPSQRFQVEHPPVLPRRADERVQVQEEGGAWETWTECEHFGGSRPRDQHITFDSITGEICFGPALREPDGSERQYGAIPPRGSLVRITYSTGGGAIGNVAAGTLTVLKSTVPYVDRVTNRHPAVGGRDAETLERAKLRAPQMLRTSFRAVTAEDYEYLAQEASASICRAHCIQPRVVSAEQPPGVIQVLLVPTVASPAERLLPEQLRVPDEVVQEVEDYLEERRLLTTVVQLDEPEYSWVSVQARIKARTDVTPETVRREVTARLYSYLNPLVGGSDGAGWPFGRSLYISEVYTILHSIAGIEYIEQASLVLETDEHKQTQPSISVPPNGLIASAEHRIMVV